MSPDRSPAYRVLVGAIALASLAHVAALAPRFFEIRALVPPRAAAVVWGILLTVATAVAACALALVLVARSWREPGARSLALFLAFLSLVWGSILRFLDVEVAPDSLSINLAAGGLDVTLAVGGIFLATAAFVSFSSVFPVPLSGESLPVPRRWGLLRRLRVRLLDRRFVWGTAIALGLVPLLGAPLLRLSRATGLGPAEGGAEAWPLLPFWLLAWFLYLGGLPLVGIGLGIRNLVTGYRLAPPEARRRVLWLVAGVSVSGWLLLGSVLLFVFLVATGARGPDWGPLVLIGLALAAPTVLVVATALALFYAGAVDPGLVLKRSTVLGALGFTGILVFAGLEEALSSWVEGRTELPGMLGSILAGAIAAGVMLPLRKGVERAAGRFLPGQEAAELGGPAGGPPGGPELGADPPAA